MKSRIRKVALVRNAGYTISTNGVALPPFGVALPPFGVALPPFCKTDLSG